MLEKLVHFFNKRHLLTNLVFITVFAAGIASWSLLKKEELPDVTFDMIRISAHYPGASAEEVEYYVTKPIEEAVQSVDGIYKVTSSTSIGTCSVSAEIEPFYDNKDEVVTEVRNAVLNVDLPEDITDDPNIRVFKTSRKAIIDIGIYFQGKDLLDVKSRYDLQQYTLALENQLTNLPEVSDVSRSGYLKDEIHIKVYPEKLKELNIPFNLVLNEIKNNNVRLPAGSIENIKEPKVTIYGELTTVEDLKDLGIQGGFEGQVVRLGEIADIVQGYEKTKSLNKINGHEGIFLRVVKSSKYGILEAIEQVTKTVEEFRTISLKNKDVKVVLLDDESFDVKNRLSLIGTNGLIGFSLILLMLFIFLDFRSGFWVAMGIPFTFCFALIVSFIMGYSINNITLAAVIIVMGMVVDDAIVVAENIKRLRSEGMSGEQAAAKGTAYMFLPVIASILTTCVAFLPLYFFQGRFGLMVKFIPVIVIIMLMGSLLEALFILPGHMILPFGRKVRTVLTLGLWPLFDLMFRRSGKAKQSDGKHWFDRCENGYGWLIKKVLLLKWLVVIAFIALLVYSVQMAKTEMKFVMFPDEETRQINFSGEAPPGTKRFETAQLTQPLEDILNGYIGKEVVGFRNDIARSRRGSAVQENKFRVRVEIQPKEAREKSADQLIKEWEEKFAGVKGITKLKFSKTWHGQDSGSPIEVLVKENNNELRDKISNEIAQAMKEYPFLKNVEVDRPISNPEYHILLDRDKIRKLAINPSDIARTLRASLEGTILYDFSGGDEPVYVRLTIVEEAKDDINKVLEIPVENQRNYLVPLKDIVTIKEKVTAESIIREDQKRTTKIDADLQDGTDKTPLEIAVYFEEKIFPEVKASYPSAIIEFGGEVKDTRESKRDFILAIYMVIIFVYIILALLFNSLVKPFIIMLAIPFGVVGIILAFHFHGINQYGFFAIIGILGLAGVVVNDAIIMVVKLDREFLSTCSDKEINHRISEIAKTRLRAVLLTTLTTVAGMIPTAYGFAGYDAMLAQMMLSIAWGLMFGTAITLLTDTHASVKLIYS